MSMPGLNFRSLLLCLALATPSVDAIPLVFGEVSPIGPLVTNLDPSHWNQSIVAPDVWAFTKTSSFVSTFAPLGAVPTYSLAWLEPGGGSDFNVVVVAADNEFILVFSDIPLSLLSAFPLFLPPAAFDSQFLNLVVPIFDPGLIGAGSFFDSVLFIDQAGQAELIPEPPSLALLALALVAAFGVIGRSRRQISNTSA